MKLAIAVIVALGLIAFASSSATLGPDTAYAQAGKKKKPEVKGCVIRPGKKDPFRSCK